MKLRRIMALAIALVMVVSTMGAIGVIGAQAATTAADPNARYATISGTGSGMSWESAFGISAPGDLQKAWDATPENGTLYLGSGNYGLQKFTIKKEKDGKSLDEFKKLVGVDRGAGKPVFEGGFTNESQGNDTLLTIADGACYIWIENIKLLNYTFGIKTTSNTEGLRFFKVDFENSSDGFYFDGGAAKDKDSRVKNIIIDGCTSKNFKKSLSRFRNGICDVIVSNCFADAGGKAFWATDNFPMAYQITGNTPDVFEERITFVDCVAQSEYHETKDPITGYWNSDGFNSERQARDITYIRCNSYDATDAGWDVKGVNPTLIDCVAMGNKRNYKFWSLGQATLINCLAAYAKTKGGIGQDCGLIANGGKKGTTDTTDNAIVVAYNSTFYNNAGTQIQNEGGILKFYNCIIGTDNTDVTGNPYGSDDPKKLITYDEPGYQNNLYYFYNTVQYVKGKFGEDPQIKAASPDWFDGKSDKWNSLKYNGSIGYHFDPNKAPAVYAPSPAGYGMIADMTAAYDWAKEAVDFMVKNDYLPGRADLKSGMSTVFGPGYNLTRAEFAAMLVRTLGLKSDKPETFTDVPADFIFANDIGIAKAVGVVKGFEAGDFMPMAQISRQDVMVMLSRALKLAGKLPKDYNGNLTMLDKFTDKATIYDYAKQDVANMVEKEIIKGGTDGTINALGNTTRAEGAVIGKRTFDMK